MEIILSMNLTKNDLVTIKILKQFKKKDIAYTAFILAKTLNIIESS